MANSLCDNQSMIISIVLIAFYMNSIMIITFFHTCLRLFNLIDFHLVSLESIGAAEISCGAQVATSSMTHSDYYLNVQEYESLFFTFKSCSMGSIALSSSTSFTADATM